MNIVTIQFLSIIERKKRKSKTADMQARKKNMKSLWFNFILLLQHIRTLLSELEINKEIQSSSRLVLWTLFHKVFL